MTPNLAETRRRQGTPYLRGNTSGIWPTALLRMHITLSNPLLGEKKIIRTLSNHCLWLLHPKPKSWQSDDIHDGIDHNTNYGNGIYQYIISINSFIYIHHVMDKTHACVVNIPLYLLYIFYYNLLLELSSHWAKTGWMNVASTSFQTPKMYVMMFNQCGKLIGFAKSNQHFFYPTFNLNPMTWWNVLLISCWIHVSWLKQLKQM